MNDRQLTDWEKRRWAEAEKGTLAYQARQVREGFAEVGRLLIEDIQAHPLRFIGVVALVELIAILLTY